MITAKQCKAQGGTFKKGKCTESWKKFSQRKEFIGYKSKDKDVIVSEGKGKDKGKWRLQIVDTQNKVVVRDTRGLKKPKALKLAKSYMKKHPRG